MKTIAGLLLLLALVGCATAQHYSALPVLRQADPTLADERTMAGFESRLAALNAVIEGDSAPGANRTATFPLTSGSRSGIPTRSVHHIYTQTEDGFVRVKSAQVVSLVIVNHAKI